MFVAFFLMHLYILLHVKSQL